LAGALRGEAGRVHGADTDGGSIVVRRLLSSSRSLWLSVAAAVVGAVAVAGWGLATQTGTNRVMAALIGVAILVVLVVVVWRRTWVDTAHGTISQSVVGVRTRRVAWAEASTIDLERNRAGQLALRVVGDGTIRATVLAVGAGGDRSMDPDQLRMLADQVATWAPERSRVADALRAQAEFVDQGGAPRESPLARRL
jgi:hypothetical protein